MFGRNKKKIEALEARVKELQLRMESLEKESGLHFDVIEARVDARLARFEHGMQANEKPQKTDKVERVTVEDILGSQDLLNEYLYGEEVKHDDE